MPALTPNRRLLLTIEGLNALTDRRFLPTA